MPEQQEFRVWSLGGLPVVSVPVEVDIGNAEGLDAALAAAGAGHPTVVADMSGTEFCDSSGLRVLLSAASRARAGGGELRLVTEAVPVLRVLAVTGVDRLFPIFATLPEALAAGPAG